MPPVLDTISVSGLSTRASTVPGSWNEENRTVEVMWSTGAPYTRHSWEVGKFVETLEVSEDACDLTRLRAGAPVLDDHNYWRGARGVLAVVEDAWIEGGKARARIRFSDREEIADLVRDVARGILHSFSVGYRVHRYEDVSEKDSDVVRLHAVEWEPFELSIAPIPAEVGAGTRSAPAAGEPYAVPIRTRTMPPEFGDGVPAPAANSGTPSPAAAAPAPVDSNRSRAAAPAAAPAPAPAAEPTPAPAPAPGPASQRSEQEILAEGGRLERARVQEIETHAQTLNLPDAAVRALIDTGRPLSELTTEVARHFEAANPDPVGEVRNQGIAVGTEQRTKARAAATEAVFARLNPGVEAPEEAGEFRGRSVIDVVRLLETMEGRDGLRMSVADIQQRAFHTTGDLPFILEEAGRRSLQRRFELQESTWRAWCRQDELTDFRVDEKIRRGDSPKLEKTPDGADVKFGTMGESKEQRKLASYSAGVSFGFQALRNDDLGAFDDLIQDQAQAVEDLVSSLVYDELAKGKVGGKVLHHASHNNTLVGELSVATIGAAKAQMRKQRSDTGRPLRLPMKYLLVPTDLETPAEQLATEIRPNQATEVNPYAGKFEVICEPRLDDQSLLEWHIVTDPAVIDTIIVSWLDGYQGPQFGSAEVFANRGMKFAVWTDVVAKAMDFRGFQKSDGVNA